MVIVISEDSKAETVYLRGIDNMDEGNEYATCTECGADLCGTCGICHECERNIEYANDGDQYKQIRLMEVEAHEK